MRFLHIADAHLDTPFASRSQGVREKLRRASREALGRALTRAIEEDVDAVLIAGDLFDGARLSFETERFLTESFRELDAAGIPCVYATGNHDPGREGAMVDRIRWPASLEVAPDDAPRRVAIRSPDGSVLGHVTAAGHAGSRETRDLASAFRRPVGSRPEIALLHARVVGSRDAEAHEPYAPTELRTLLTSGYHYWALGHVHERQTLAETPAVHYPGNLQGRTHAEAGPRGCSLVEVTDGRASIDFVPCGPIRWETLRLEALHDVHNLDELVAATRRRWDAVRADDPDPHVDWMLRVDLRGGIPLWRALAEKDNRKVFAREVQRHLGAIEVEVRVDRIHAVVDPSEHDERLDLLGVALRRLRALREGTEAAEGDLVAGLAGPTLGLVEEPLADYVADLLVDAEGDLLARLLDPEAAEG